MTDLNKLSRFEDTPIPKHIKEAAVLQVRATCLECGEDFAARYLDVANGKGRFGHIECKEEYERRILANQL